MCIFVYSYVGGGGPWGAKNSSSGEKSSTNSGENSSKSLGFSKIGE
jgi:hypothetical protein